MRRFQQDKQVMESRRKEMIRLGHEWLAKRPLGRWRKRHPLDCGNPKCGICHSMPRGRPQLSRKQAINDALKGE
jgi:hypothetical protein